MLPLSQRCADYTPTLKLTLKITIRKYAYRFGEVETITRKSLSGQLEYTGYL